ncbi:hypothetical protein BR93DRAFT_486532 [Coniochaeta sp. PMI_546]|nr:hypothetical protein BR93DRAFT_486532 [Coniochaeta sp. PMI_546]
MPFEVQTHGKWSLLLVLCDLSANWLPSRSRHKTSPGLARSISAPVRLWLVNILSSLLHPLRPALFPTVEDGS